MCRQNERVPFFCPGKLKADCSIMPRNIKMAFGALEGYPFAGVDILSLTKFVLNVAIISSYCYFSGRTTTTTS